mgnify:CR=1 FL=1|tara:strand:- start:1381 stop:1644 length:264 start_codon:yes stop_codon:yes gene_type:complete
MKEMGVCYSQTYSYSPVTIEESEIFEPPPSAFDYQPEPEIEEEEEEEPELVDDTYDIIENVETTPQTHQEPTPRFRLTFRFIKKQKK